MSERRLIISSLVNYVTNKLTEERKHRSRKICSRQKNVILDEDHTHPAGGQLKKQSDLAAQREQAY